MGISFCCGPDIEPDRYRITQHSVDGGAEGQLHRGVCRTKDMEFPVAIKVLNGRHSANFERFRQSWQQQTEILRSLRHLGVVGVRDTFVGPPIHRCGEVAPDGKDLYLVMDWEEGDALPEWLARNRATLDVYDMLKPLTQVGAALDYLHSGDQTQGIPVVHRDVKPSNIIMTDRGAVLVDFGLARPVSSVPSSKGVGTLVYLAPEARLGHYSPASDRFALGGVAYYVITGANPPVDADPAQIRATLAATPAGRAEPALVDDVAAMLDPDPAHRPAGAAEFIAQLRQSTLSHVPGEDGADLPLVGAAGVPPVGAAAGAAATVPLMGAQKTIVEPHAASPGTRDGRARPDGDDDAARRRRRVLIPLLLVVVLGGGGTAALLGSAVLHGGGDTATNAGTVSTTTLPPTTIETTTTTTTSLPPTTTTTAPPTTTASAMLAADTSSAEPQSMLLSDLSPVSQTYHSGKDTENVDGNTYPDTFWLGWNDPCFVGVKDDQYIKLNLDRKWASLATLLGASDKSNENFTAQVRIDGDGRLLFNGTVKMGATRELHLDVHDVLRLTITAKLANACGPYGDGKLFVALPNAALSK